MFTPRREKNLRRATPGVEPCEDRTLTTLVFILNGNGFAAAGTSSLTANAAAVIRASGNQPVQVPYSAVTLGSFEALAAKLIKAAHGQRVGLVGFSAGGAVALRLAEVPGLNAIAVLDYYGVPDVQAYLQRHAVDHNYRPIEGLAPFRGPIISLLSGPVRTYAKVVAAFGAYDPNVGAATSSADLRKDAPRAHIYTYAGAHGVPITASIPALTDFLNDL